MADINIYSIGSKMLICCLKGNLDYCKYLYHNGYQNDITRPNINLRTPMTAACSASLSDTVTVKPTAGVDRHPWPCSVVCLPMSLFLSFCLWS